MYYCKAGRCDIKEKLCCKSCNRRNKCWIVCDWVKKANCKNKMEDIK